MKLILTTLFCVLLSFSAGAQNATTSVKKPASTPTSTKEKTVVEQESPLFVAEVMPTFNGQNPSVSFKGWCAQNLTYPPIASENGIQGKVIVSFVIDTCGKLINEKIIRGASPELDTAAINVVRKAPALWTPGKQGGRPVKVMYQVPLIFTLQ